MNPDEDIAYLEAVVPVMRRLGVVEGFTLRLGPTPADPEATQPTHIPAEDEVKAREERRRIAMASSGGPVPRLDADSKR